MDIYRHPIVLLKIINNESQKPNCIQWNGFLMRRYSNINIVLKNILLAQKVEIEVCKLCVVN